MDNIELIGYAATLFGAIQMVPEIIKALKTHHLKDVAWGMLWLMNASSVLWIIYGLSREVLPLTISAGMNLLFQVILVSLKIHYDKAKRPLMKPVGETQPVTDR